MIKLSNGWAQWDHQIGTFRAEVGGVIYGVCTDDKKTAQELSGSLPEPLAADQINELEAEKSAWQQ